MHLSDDHQRIWRDFVLFVVVRDIVNAKKGQENGAVLLSSKTSAKPATCVVLDPAVARPPICGPMELLPNNEKTKVEFCGFEFIVPGDHSHRVNESCFEDLGIIKEITALHAMGFSILGVMHGAHFIIFDFMRTLCFEWRKSKHKEFKDANATIFNRECPICTRKFVWNASIMLRPCGHATHANCCPRFTQCFIIRLCLIFVFVSRNGVAFVYVVIHVFNAMLISSRKISAKVCRDPASNKHIRYRRYRKLQHVSEKFIL